MSATTLAVVTFDEAYLLLPQSSVASVEMSTSIDGSRDVAGAIGTIHMGPLKWPAFALTPTFDLRTDCPEHFRCCVAFNHGDQPAFALTCEEVDTIEIADEAALEPVQDCMQSSKNPIRSLIIRNGKLMLVSDIATFRDFLGMETAA